MRCPKCGETYDNSWKICVNCTEKLVDDAVISSKKADELKENIKKSRRPKLLTVRVFGIYIIIVGLIKLFLVNAVEPSQDIIIGNFLSLLLIICGVGVFFLINYARLCVMTYFATNGAITVIFFFCGLVGRITNFKTPMKDVAGYTPIDTLIWFVITLFLSSAFYFLPVVFLRTHAIKEQFK